MMRDVMMEKNQRAGMIDLAGEMHVLTPYCCWFSALCLEIESKLDARAMDVVSKIL